MTRLPHPARQRGVVLVTTAILLVLLTIMALAAVSMNSTQTRVATNSADNQIAYQTAEGALNMAITALNGGTYAPASFSANANGLYVLNETAAPVWMTQANWTTAIQCTTACGTGTSVAYIIERLPSVIKPGQNANTPTSVYRITARSMGKSGGSPVYLQSTVQIQ